MKKYNLAIVGVTGLVGRMFLKILDEYHFPFHQLLLYASKKSAGKKIVFKNKEYIIRELSEEAFDDVDIVLFSAGSKVSQEYAPLADNSSAWRMDDNCALVVPEVNMDDIFVKSKIIANPNCSTIQAVLPLKILNDHFGIKRVTYTTYQAVSGSGQKGIEDLKRTKNNHTNIFYPYDISKTCIPEIDEFLDNGYTKEEMKMINETRKILKKSDLRITATTVRVPVENSHSESINIEFEKPFELSELVETLKSFEGIIVQDDPASEVYPIATNTTGHDEVFVGRIRRDFSVENGVNLWVVADNIRKGAASNAIQIVEKMIEK